MITQDWHANDDGIQLPPEGIVMRVDESFLSPGIDFSCSYIRLPGRSLLSVLPIYLRAVPSWLDFHIRDDK